MPFFSKYEWLDIPANDRCNAINSTVCSHEHDTDEAGSHQHTINQLPTHDHTIGDVTDAFVVGTGMQHTNPSGDVTPTEQSAGSHSHSVSSSNNIIGWMPPSNDATEKLLCEHAGPQLPLMLPTIVGSTISALRVKYCNLGINDRIQVQLFKRKDSDSTPTWTKIHEFTPARSASIVLATENITPFIVESGFSYLICIISYICDTQNVVLSVGYKFTKCLFYQGPI